MSIDVWTGFTLTLATTGITFKVRKWTWNPPQKKVVDITHQGSTQATAARSFGGSEFKTGRLPDPGTWMFEILHEPTLAFPAQSTSAFETLTVQPPSQICSGAFAASGILLAPPSFTHGIDDEPYATVEFKLTGIVTMPAS